MVAPKVPSNKAKEKNDEKKPISASPEPFQEPDGMTTIDLNKSDDYSREIEHERAMQKQRAQLRYVTQLIFALGAIFLVVLTTIIFGFANKRYHFFHINQLNESNQIFQPTPSPTEEFVNITRMLNQALFREKLKSGNYLYDSYEELNLCQTKQTVDACCSVFENTDLHGLTDYCTVNEMLNILLEYELDRRKKRQVRDFDEYHEITLDKSHLKELQQSKYPLNERTNLEFNDPNLRHDLVDPNISHQNIQSPTNFQNNLQIPNVPGPSQHQTSNVHNVQVIANGNLNFPENVPVNYHTPNQPNNHEPGMVNFNSYPEVPKSGNVMQPKHDQEFMPVYQQPFNQQPPVNFPQQVVVPSDPNFGQNMNYGPQNVADQNQDYQQQPISPHMPSNFNLENPSPIPQWPNPIQNQDFIPHNMGDQPKKLNSETSPNFNPLPVNLNNQSQNQQQPITRHIESFPPPTNVNLENHSPNPQLPNPHSMHNQEFIPHNMEDQLKNLNSETSSNFNPLSVNSKNPSENQRLIPSNMYNQQQQQPINPHIESLFPPTKVNLENHSPIPQSPNTNPMQNHQEFTKPKNLNSEPSSNFNPLPVNLKNPSENQRPIPFNMDKQNQNDQPNFPHMQISNINQNSEGPLPQNIAGKSEQKHTFTSQTQNQQESERIVHQPNLEHNGLDQNTETGFGMQTVQEIPTSLAENPKIPEEHFKNTALDQKILHFTESNDKPFTTEAIFLNNPDEIFVLPTSWLKTNRSDNLEFEENISPLGKHPKTQTTKENLSETDKSPISLQPAEKHDESPLSNIPNLEKDKSSDAQSTTKTHLPKAIEIFVDLSKPRQTQEKIHAKVKQPLDDNPTPTKTLLTEKNHFQTDESTSPIPPTIAETLKSPLTSTSHTLPTETIVGLSRSRQPQEEIRTKAKQMDSFTASEDIQSNQQAFVNPCFYPYMNPYTSFMPAPGRVGSIQEPGFLKVVQVTPQKSQNQPMYVLNPAMYYGTPPIPSPQLTYQNYPANPYMASGFFPSQPGSIASANSLNSQVQVTSPGGQYFMCNPIPTPTNNIAHLAGIEVRRESSNLQSLMDDVEDVAASNNKSRAASIILCPLGEQACLDNSKCIKNYHICDGEVHCDDSSDEIACTCKERVGKLRLCDGYCDCPRCEDEQGCFGCGINEFSCDDWSRFRRSTCIPLVQKCDGIKQCEVTGKDEMDCSMLADHIGNFPLSKVSNSVGFLHRNYKGKWYPTCFGTQLWAAQVCTVEAGPSAMIPKAHMTLTTDPYDGLFINVLPNSEVSLVNTCVQDRAAFVECPPIYCGLRFLVNNPYRNEEVDTSIEDLLSDLERAYKVKEGGYERINLEAELDRIKNNHQDLDLSTKGKLTHEQLEEVIEDLEKTFTRRHVSEDENVDFILKDSRVVGGKPSQPASWPWLVSIYKNGIFHCGGVLINELWIVTASHCADRYWQYYYEVQAGALRRFSYSPMDQRRWVIAVVVHEFYSKTNLRNDIALMKLSAPIRYNRYVRPICLPSETTSGKDYLNSPTAGTICTTVGWGATAEHGADPDHMREVEVPILHHCKHKEDSDTEEICAGLTEGGRDACQGDSGGPLMCRNPNNPNQWYLAGIVSHGEGCARPNEPGVYTRVSKYMGWMAENTREDKVTTRNPLQKCPGYTCKGTRRCVPKKRRCDRIIDCLLGDDEMDCENKFREIFKHSKKSLLPPIDTNAYEDYDDADDLTPSGDDFEILESRKNYTDSFEDKSKDYLDNAPKINTEFEKMYFRCKVLLQIIPIEKRCNKIFDCEDGSDETDCTCADYIRTTDADAICDGVTDCTDLSDENNCVHCNKTEYLCPFSQKCIELTKRCDGTVDCPLKDDEINCVSLTNGQNITLDKDNRPMFKSRGIATINHEGQWKPFCLNKTSQFIGNEPALGTIFCNLLGFDDYLTYNRYRIEDVTINSSYSMISGKVVQDYESKHCENCCDGLYISCSNTSTSTTLQHESLKEAKELYFSPWMAAIYFNGQYKCMGTVLDKLWIVTSNNCVKGLHVIKTNYITAVLGKGKLHITEKGPHEQIIRVTSSININDTDIVLLRLENYIFYNRYVQAADLNVRRDGLQIEKCYAIGEDNDNKVMFVPLAPLKHCLVGYRCFEKKIEEDCQDNSWSGTIICDTRMGWYPAAVFAEEKGHCGFSHTKKYTSVKFYKNLVFEAMAMTPDPILPPICHGFQCPLGNCIMGDKICNDINDCHNGEDESATLCYEKEKQCHVEDKCVCSPTDLKCPTTNKCFPKSSFCDRTNNCGEFEDEPDVCTCRNYLKLTNPGKICDGTLNCMDRSDEDPEICSCKLGDFQCGKLNKCVPQDMVCDGVEDCPNGEDEAACLILKTENREKTNAGEVMTRTAGIWHNGCFNSNYSTTQLEQICTQLGFDGGSASQLTPPHNTTELTTLRPILDSFEVVWLRRQPGNKMKLRMRTGYNPYVTFLADEDCHRLFIACI